MCRIVGRSISGVVWVVLFAAVGLPAMGQSEVLAATLKPKTLKAFNDYVAVAEARMNREDRNPNDFLYIETVPKPQYDSIMAALKRGEVYVQPVRMQDAEGDPIDIPDGMIHHWVGDVFIPGKSVATALEVLRDYDNFKNIYKPEVIDSKLISRQDNNDFNVFLRLQKQSIVTVTLDTWYNIHFTPIGDNGGISRSVSTRIQQVEDAGTPHEHLDPAGDDSGYLWRINSYWRYQERDNGVIIEWESIALSRDVPFLLAWFVNPLIRKIAREAVEDMLTATRKAVMEEKAQQKQAESPGHPPSNIGVTRHAALRRHSP